MKGWKSPLISVKKGWGKAVSPCIEKVWGASYVAIGKKGELLTRFRRWGGGRDAAYPFNVTRMGLVFFTRKKWLDMVQEPNMNRKDTTTP